MKKLKKLQIPGMLGTIQSCRILSKKYTITIKVYKVIFFLLFCTGVNLRLELEEELDSECVRTGGSIRT